MRFWRATSNAGAGGSERWAAPEGRSNIVARERRMAFFNFYMLFFSAAVAVPILIHILNRKSAKRVMWGAMRFLRDSLISRRRKILLEEILLMCLRCLAVMSLVLVASRPFITPGSRFAWLIILPLLLVSVSGFAVSFIIWQYPRARWSLLLGAALLLLVAGIALVFEERLQSRIFGADGARDIALIIDASDSMDVKIGGVSNFARALEEARSVIASAPYGSAFSLIVGGGMPYAPVASPISDREEVLTALDSIEGEKDLIRAPEAITLAAFTLAKGNNAAKQIIIFSDARRKGWNLAGSGGEWNAVKECLEQLSSVPPVILRRLDFPDSVRNAAVSGISFSREAIGLDREVGINVTVANNGTESVTPEGLRLTIGDSAYMDDGIGQIPPGNSVTLTFDHHFQALGSQLVHAELLVDDDLPLDNHAWRHVIPLEELKVLIVDGNPSPRFFERASAFAALALSPFPQTRKGLDPQVGVENMPDAAKSLVKPRVIDAHDLPSLPSLSPYSVIILADVPRLPEGTAEALAEYVSSGGGLLVAHGARTRIDFFNEWKTDDCPFMPGVIEKQLFPEVEGGSEKLASPAPATFIHPALSRFRDEGLDLSQVILRSYWQLSANDVEPPVRTGARLANQYPFILDRSLGKGRIVQFACSLDSSDSNLPSTKAFVLILHQLVSHLSGVGNDMLNIDYRPGAAIPISALAATGEENLNQPSKLAESGLKDMDIIDSGGIHRRGKMLIGDDIEKGMTLLLPPNISPGNHCLRIPEAIRGEFRHVLTGEDSLPFVLLRAGSEGRLSALDESDSARLRRYLLWQEAVSEEQMLGALEGARFGREIWRPLALAAFLLLLGEIAASRWIAIRRQLGSKLTIDFQSSTRPGEKLRQDMKNFSKEGGVL